jgi:hypothetical protein
MRQRRTDDRDHRLWRAQLRLRAQHGSDVADGQYQVDPPARSRRTTAQGIP